MSKYEIVRKTKVGEYIQNDVPFFVVDMQKKKVYSSRDLRLGELLDKLDKDSSFIIKEC
jgi:hypothetical protein